jgi:hypothetical protein
MSPPRIRNSRDIGSVDPVLTLLPEELNLPPYFFPLEISQADFAVPPSAFYSPDCFPFALLIEVQVGSGVFHLSSLSSQPIRN